MNHGDKEMVKRAERIFDLCDDSKCRFARSGVCTFVGRTAGCWLDDYNPTINSVNTTSCRMNYTVKLEVLENERKNR